MGISFDQLFPSSVLLVAATNYPDSPSRSLPVVKMQTHVPSGMTTVYGWSTKYTEGISRPEAKFRGSVSWEVKNQLAMGINSLTWPSILIYSNCIYHPICGNPSPFSCWETDQC